MFRRSIATLLSLIALSGLVAAPLATAEDTVTWAVTCDWTAVLEGETGAWVETIVADEEVARKRRALDALTGFDPLTDLDGARLAGRGPDPDRGVLVVDGRFEGERLVAMVGGIDGYRSEGGRPEVHSWIDPDKQKRVYAAVVEDRRIVIGGQLDAVRVTLAEGLPAVTAPEVPGTVLLSGQVSGLQHLPELPQQAEILRQLDGASVVFSEHAGDLVLTMELSGRDPEAAARIAKILDGLHALATLGDPTEQGPVAVTAIENFSLERDGAVLRAHTSVPIALLREHADGQALRELQQRSAEGEATTDLLAE